ncbi:MAG: SGNH/GDSL hydrolase family protein [Bacteroidota bacterium]|nr:SGNH/GDSL hydrolase family protein [Bacteroidota bacterium]
MNKCTFTLLFLLANWVVFGHAKRTDEGSLPINRAKINSFTFIEGTGLAKKTLISSTERQDLLNDICLPSVTYMLSNTQNDLFVEPFIKRWRPYEQYVRFEGTKFSRRLQRVASVSSPSEGEKITATLYDGNTEDFSIIKRDTTIIRVGEKGTGTDSVRAQVLGDSYTQGAFYKDALITKGYVPLLDLVGLRKCDGNSTAYYDEGRGGATLNTYFTVSTGKTIHYNPFFQPSGNFRYWGATGFWKMACTHPTSGTNTFNEFYNCGFYRESALSKFDARTGLLAKPREGDIMYDNDQNTYIIFSGAKWRKTNYSVYTWAFQYDKYLSMWNLKCPDFLFVMLGLNDFRRNIQADFTAWNQKMELMAKSFLESNPDGKFVLCTPASTCGQMDNAAGDFTVYQNAAMWRARKNIIDHFDNREQDKIYIVDVATRIDNEYGYEYTSDSTYTKPYEGYRGEAKLAVQTGNPHPYLNYPSMGIPLAAFIQYYRGSLPHKTKKLIPGRTK